MGAQIIDGKLISGKVKEEVKKEVQALKEKGIVPKLTVVLVGDDPASQIYVSKKQEACERVGIRSFSCRFPEDTGFEIIKETIEELNESNNRASSAYKVDVMAYYYGNITARWLLAGSGKEIMEF